MKVTDQFDVVKVELVEGRLRVVVHNEVFFLKVFTKGQRVMVHIFNDAWVTGIYRGYEPRAIPYPAHMVSIVNRRKPSAGWHYRLDNDVLGVDDYAARALAL